MNLREAAAAIDRGLVEAGARVSLDGLTKNQLLVFRALETFVGLHGYSPTVRELADLTGLKSKGSVHPVLIALREKGLVEWQPNSTSTLRPTRNGGR